MEQITITITLSGAAADKLRKAVEPKKDEHRRIDWTGYSPLLKK